MDEAVAREMVEQADSDGNEVLDYSEFEKLWSQIRSDTEVRGGVDWDCVQAQDHFRTRRRSERSSSGWTRIRAVSLPRRR